MTNDLKWGPLRKALNRAPAWADTLLGAIGLKATDTALSCD
jgi:hypothetical protein